ncbi:MAG: peptidylprolyl isomerase [Clostridiales bacterium]|nr:peptidylprolyl isomerase [Clostridiales bacterium]
MKKIILILIVVMLLVGCSENDSNNSSDAGQKEDVPNTSVVIVNDKEISIEMFNKYYAMQSYDFEKEFGASVWDIEQDGKTMKEIRQDQTLDYLIRVALVESYIDDKNLKVNGTVIDEAYGRYMDSIKNDAEIKTYFEENRIDEVFLKRFLQDQYYLRIYSDLRLEEISNDPKTHDVLFADKYIRYKTRHILLDSQEVLQEVLSLLNDEENPADFSDMARLYSIHATSAVKGGDLGYILVGNMPEEYEKVALEIEPYTVSEPVQTEYGFHLIFVDDRQMLQDMIDTGMPEEEIDGYKADIIKDYAAKEMLRIYNEMESQAVIEMHKELLNEDAVDGE